MLKVMKDVYHRSMRETFYVTKFKLFYIFDEKQEIFVLAIYTNMLLYSLQSKLLDFPMLILIQLASYSMLDCLSAFHSTACFVHVWRSIFHDLRPTITLRLLMLNNFFCLIWSYWAFLIAEHGIKVQLLNSRLRSFVVLCVMYSS